MKKAFARTLALVMTMAMVLTGCGSNGGDKSNAGASASGSTSTSGAAETDWPKETVTMVVPYSAGGDTDTYCRQMSKLLGEQLGVNFVVVNTTGVLFDLLGKWGDRAAITAAGDCLSTALYTLLRHLYRRSGGNEDFFATDPVDFDAGAVDAAMLCSRASYLRALAGAEQMPELTSDALTAAPGLGQSTAQVVHNVDELAGRQ